MTALVMRRAGPIVARTQQQSTQQILAVGAAPTLHNLNSRRDKSYKCVVLGGGAGGCAMASKMARKFGAGKVAVVEPQDVCFTGLQSFSASVSYYKIMGVLFAIRGMNTILLAMRD